jgi:hypothetical protein
MAEMKCKNCGQLFDSEMNPKTFGFGTTTSGYHCSYHPGQAVKTDHATGARDGYVDVWEFPCCGKLQPGGEFDGRSLPPPRAPGCQTGSHEPDPNWPPGARARGHEFNVFLSFNSDDVQFAQQIYDFLIARQIRVFFSRESIPQLGQSDYMEAIHEALDKAHHFILVTGSPDNAKTGWVRSERSIFLNEIRSGRKDGNLVVALANDSRIDQLPIALRATQVVTLSESGLEDLLQFVT